MQTLTVQRRQTSGKGAARKLRAQGLVPGICYGPKIKDPIEVIVDTRKLKKSLDGEKRINSLVKLTIEGDGAAETHEIMVREFQLDHVKQVVTHVDLVAVDPDRHLNFQVPVTIEGKAAGVSEGGVLKRTQKQIKVKCKPADVPAAFALDVTSLTIGQSRAVRDLDFPDGVRPITLESTTLIRCEAARKVEATDEAAAAPEAAAEGAAPAAN